jgi:hypothetical protein
MPLSLNAASAIVNYSNRTVKSVIHDLLVKYGKDEIVYIIDQCVCEIEGDATEQILEFVRGIRDGKFHSQEHPDEPCRCNEMAAANFLITWRGLTSRAADEAYCECIEPFSRAKVIDGVCSFCKSPRR